MSSSRPCLALVQLVGLEAIEARVPAAMARAKASASQLVHELSEELGGDVGVSSVRGMAVQFEEASAACTFAIRIHERLLTLDWPATVLVHPDAAEVRSAEGVLLHRGLRARAAIHRGPFHRTANGLKGPAVYQAARLLHAAHAGQTLISSEAWRYLRGPLPAGAVLRDLGPHSLPGVQGATRVFQLMPEALDARDFPVGLVQHVASQRRAPILGREGDLEALRELLVLGVRWIHVAGHRGVGRSRLCAQLAAHPPETFRRAGGVFTVRPRSNETLEIVRAVADVLSVPLSRATDEARAIEQLGHAFLALGSTLLVVDGHEASRRALARWLDLAPELRVVVHSTEATEHHGATTYLLRPLACATGPGARHTDAVRLYTLAATSAQTSFVLGEPVDVALSVKALGGNALAIRIAGGAVTQHSASQLAARFLGRQVPLEEMVDLAVEALTDEERAVLRVCALIPGWFEPDLPNAMLDEPLPREGIVATLRALATRSLLVRRIDAELAQVTRFGMPEAIADVLVGQCSAETRQSQEARLAHLVLERCGRWSQQAFGRNRPEVLARLALDWEKLLAIIDWGVARAPDDAAWADRAMQAVLVLEPVLRSRGPLPLELLLLDASIRAGDSVLGNDPVLQVRALVARADCRLRAGVEGHQSDLDRARSLAERWGDARGVARSELIQGRVWMVEGDNAHAVEAFRDVRVRFEELGDPMRAALARALEGSVHLRTGDFEQAEVALVEGSMGLRAVDARHLLARVLGWMGELYRRTGRTTAARSVSREAIRLHEELGSVVAECRTRQELATLDYQLTRYGESSAGLARAIERARAIGDRRQESHALLLLAVVSIARADHATARGHLLEALALSRERNDPHAEGRVMAYLGLLYHFDEQPDAARTYYAQAITQLHRQRAYRLEALFTAWRAELEAEQLHVDECTQQFEAAREVLTHSYDRHTEQAVRLLSQVRVLAEGVLRGQPEEGRQALRERLKGTDPRALSAEARLAYRRVRRLATRGLLQRSPPPAAPGPESSNPTDGIESDR